MKRGLDEPNDETDCVFDVEVMEDGLWAFECCDFVTFPLLVEEQSVASIMLGTDPRSEGIDFCGVKAKIWVRTESVDDAGIPKRFEEAQTFCSKHNTKVLTSRWVTTHRVIEGEDGVRSRIAVKDFASTKAKSSGVSSPTPSTEGLKAVLALASANKMHLTSLDVSAAFMHTPLRSHCKYMVKMPLSLTWEDGSPIYLEMQRALMVSDQPRVNGCIM